MRNLLEVILEQEHGPIRLIFTDSIGSFGKSAPRENCPANWLVANAEQDPGSDYGRQKRGCRDLMLRPKNCIPTPFSPPHHSEGIKFLHLRRESLGGGVSRVCGELCGEGGDVG